MRTYKEKYLAGFLARLFLHNPLIFLNRHKYYKQYEDEAEQIYLP